MKKNVFLCLMVFIALLLFVGVATSENGDCGDNLTWDLNSAGVLTISGTGEIPK